MKPTVFSFYVGLRRKHTHRGISSAIVIPHGERCEFSAGGGGGAAAAAARGLCRRCSFVVVVAAAAGAAHC